MPIHGSGPPRPKYPPGTRPGASNYTPRGQGLATPVGSAYRPALRPPSTQVPTSASSMLTGLAPPLQPALSSREEFLRGSATPAGYSTGQHVPLSSVISEVNLFLRSSSFQNDTGMEVPRQTRPSAQEIRTIFDWLYSQLDTNYQNTGMRYEDEAMEKLLLIGYPQLESVRKEHFRQPNTATAWPVVLAVLSWMCQVLQALEDERRVANAIPLPEQTYIISIEDEYAFQAYHAHLDPRKGTALEQYRSEMNKELDNYISEAKESTKVLTEDISELEDVEKSLEREKTSRELVVQRAQELERDQRKLDVHMAKLDTRRSEIEELENQEKHNLTESQNRLKSVDTNMEELQTKVAAMGLNVERIRRLNQEKCRLNESLLETSKEVEELETSNTSSKRDLDVRILEFKSKSLGPLNKDLESLLHISLQLMDPFENRDVKAPCLEDFVAVNFNDLIAQLDRLTNSEQAQVEALENENKQLEAERGDIESDAEVVRVRIARLEADKESRKANYEHYSGYAKNERRRQVEELERNRTLHARRLQEAVEQRNKSQDQLNAERTRGQQLDADVEDKLKPLASKVRVKYQSMKQAYETMGHDLQSALSHSQHYLENVNNLWSKLSDLGNLSFDCSPVDIETLASRLAEERFATYLSNFEIDA